MVYTFEHFFFRVKVEVRCIKLINETYYEGMSNRHIILKQFRPGDAVKKNIKKPWPSMRVSRFRLETFCITEY